VTVIDTSVVVAIFAAEAEGPALLDAISTNLTFISAGTYLEASIVLARLATAPPRETNEWLDDFIERSGTEIVAVSVEHARLARAAYQQYGKGTGHPAQLNFGDCFAYALAKAMNVPLLYKGGDFAKTDIASAL
jgi:ribonuclease VapC